LLVSLPPAAASFTGPAGAAFKEGVMGRGPTRRERLDQARDIALAELADAEEQARRSGLDAGLF
jgi:hypothetical protein